MKKYLLLLATSLGFLAPAVQAQFSENIYDYDLVVPAKFSVTLTEATPFFGGGDGV